jgi:hypothetical protein
MGVPMNLAGSVLGVRGKLARDFLAAFRGPNDHVIGAQLFFVFGKVVDADRRRT